MHEITSGSNVLEVSKVHEITDYLILHCCNEGKQYGGKCIARASSTTAISLRLGRYWDKHFS